jgi:hypothetical protein
LHDVGESLFEDVHGVALFLAIFKQKLEELHVGGSHVVLTRSELCV